MAYTINWNSAEPVGSTLPAGQLDDEIRKTRKGTEERMATIIGNDNWATNVDPVIDGINIKSLAVLSAEATVKATPNPTLNFLPRKGSSATAFVDSAISDDGAKLDFSTRALKINGLDYTWPAAATEGFFLQYTAGGNLVWASAGAGGIITGTGTSPKIPMWTGPTSLADSLISQSGGSIGINGVLTVQQTVNAAAVSVTGLINAANISASTSIGSPQFVAGSMLILSASILGGKYTLSVNHTTGASGFAIDLNSSASEYRVFGTKVVGTRQTGWGNMSGTATRTSFATSTVTLPELAQRVKALIDDLSTHGMIGN